MLNTYQYNTTLYADQPKPETGGLPTDAIRFGSFGLQNDQICVSVADHWDFPDRDFNTDEKPSRNGRIFISDAWDQKEINIGGTLVTNTAEELDTLIFNLKKSLAAKEQNLDIQLADGSYRRYKATCVKADIGRSDHYHITHCPVVLSFECGVPFGTDTDASSLLYETSLTSFTEDIIVGGSVETLPMFVFIVESAVNVDKLRITNNTTGKVIESSMVLADGDVIIIDTENYSVTQNFVEKDYTGVFPEFITGTNNITIEAVSDDVDIPAITYSVTCKFYNSYL